MLSFGRNQSMKRRTFLKSSTVAVAAAGAVLNAEAALRGELRKSLYWGMLPDTVSITERFKIIKRCGYAGVEIPTTENEADLAEMKKAAADNGIAIHSIMNSKHWKSPFSSDDPAVIKDGMDGMMTSLRNAKEVGADTVLLVPAVVNAETSYRDAYTRSQVHIRELLPVAKELDIVIAVENVWNKFLLSPIEFARYVDEFESPYLQAYFDCGNIALYGFPHDWIRTLGRRIVKVHIKGFDTKKREFTNILDGTIDWKEIRRAFSDIRYNGYIGAELSSGDEAYLKDISMRMDKIIGGTL